MGVNACQVATSDPFYKLPPLSYADPSPSLILRVLPGYGRLQLVERAVNPSHANGSIRVAELFVAESLEDFRTDYGN